MKPPRFAYYDPTTLGEALTLLRELGPSAKVLAGGQSLVPLLNMRLSRPDALVDLGKIPNLAYIREVNGYVAVGAMTRQRAVENDPVVAARVPLLHKAMPNIGHVQIRNRGTIGGSLAHADPAAELPTVAAALGATLVVESFDGSRREVSPEDFFLGPFTTNLMPGEILVEVRWPVAPPLSGSAFLELARRKGDFAICGVACQVALEAGGRVKDVRLGLTGVGAAPVVPAGAAEPLLGTLPSEAAIAEVARRASAATAPETDIHATAEYRRHLAEILTRRALVTALRQAAMARERGDVV